MNSFFFILIALGALATLFVLVRGIVLMASGKDVGGKRQNKLMVNRVILQAVTILIVVVFLMFASGR
ncbi:hypothetical protein BSL82_14515 [Tardibacter chloracetimidivorans]|uniref:HIG1 domain-containing protein n=1 Tax=Tardibacter chloracetimidivorans TaxID=1921510 RepID=A0A1L3ZXM7_9SPHN|nr:HIG1 domain-containing protein [Tardibacter chloracetimidivorans]API60349.1 hypothetical protein BSL82_14515 [Tardibacter chloracetimidivorans]